MSQDISIAVLQNDIGFKLNSENYFEGINVQLERKELYSSELQIASIWQTVKDGTSGVGVVVQMPEINVQDPDSPGPELVCFQKISVLEEPNINQTEGTGTQIFAEDIGIYIIQLLHQFSLAQNITLEANGQVMVPNRENPGIRGVDLRFQYRFTPPALNQCATVPISFNDGECTLTCATEATIYYTTDGSFPGPANATTVKLPDGSYGTAQVYDAPFAVESETQIRAAAYANGYVGSPVWMETAP